MIPRLSRPLVELRDRYTAVVIGSGYGGGVAACRLARAGQSVCVLERGKELRPGEYPDTPDEALRELQMSPTPVNHGHWGARSGLFDLHRGGDLAVLVGCGLGGTSLINANVALKPDPRVFDDSWPEILRREDPELEHGYERAATMLEPLQYPGREPAKLHALHQSADAMGVGDRFSRADIYVTFEDGVNAAGVEQKACTGCGDCVSGCNVGAKNTVLMNYLPDAHRHGAEIFTEVLVHHLEPAGTAWRVMFETLDWRTHLLPEPLRSVTADIVVLAAGTLGSTEILLRSREHLELSKSLGERFSGNGDVLGIGFGASEPVYSMGLGTRDPGDAYRVPPGPCITGLIDLRETPKLDDGIMIQEGAAPGVLADVPRFVAQLAPDPAHRPDHDALAHTQVYLAMGHDGTGGRLVPDDEGHVQVEWKDIVAARTFNEANEKLAEAARAIGATFVPDPARFLPHDLLTVHPLGGCPMADNAERGVVNDRGQVFKGSKGSEVHPGLYVADGAIIPRSLGNNPSLTITALAERIAWFLIRDRGWHFDDRPAERRPPDGPPPDHPSDGNGTRHRPTLVWRERMTGHVATEFFDDFRRAANLGRANNSEFEMIVTIIGEDVERVLADPQHECRLRGSVRAPKLAEGWMRITDGTFRLFTLDPERAEMHQMHYRMRIEADDGTAYHVHGYKDVHDDPGFDVWSDTTTLYVTVAYEDDRLRPFGQGILRMKPADFLRELMTMTVHNAPDVATRNRYLLQFGKMFSESLFITYGKIFAEPYAFSRKPPRRRRPLRAGHPTPYRVPVVDGTSVLLNRYQGGSKGPVVLAHAFGTSTEFFRTPTIDPNLVEFLTDRHYDVWLFDNRGSPDVAASRRSVMLDDIARRDWPAATTFVREEANVDDVQVVAHCVGSMTFLMAMLAGMRGVRSAVCSALSAHPVPNTLNRLKGYLGLTRILPMMGLTDFNTTVRGSLKDRLWDLALFYSPGIPSHERCDSPVCRRIFTIYGPSYNHDQLNEATHDELHLMFGREHVTSFIQITQILRAGKVVSIRGKDTYLRDQLGRLAIPIRFIHGRENQEFMIAGTQTTFDLLRATNDPSLYDFEPLEGYGHMDTFIGKNAARDVFPKIVEHLDRT